MKKIVLPLIFVLFLALAACGGGGNIDTDALATRASDAAGNVSEAVEDVVDTVEEELADTSDGTVGCDLDAMEVASGYDATLHLINSTGETLTFSWLDITQDPPVLSDRGEVADGETFDQFTTIGHVFVANNANGEPVFEYEVTEDEKQCTVIESTAPIELTLVDEGPTGEMFDVDPTQPIDVTDDSDTQVKIDANALVDDNGNPPAGDVQVNLYTPDPADEEDTAQSSTACEEPDTSDMLTVWTYNPETGLWEVEDPAPIQDERCVESVGTVSMEVTDDDGNAYDLAEGAKAEVSIPCQPTPDEVLTVWSYDETTGLWVEEDSVVVQEGERCTAEVSDPGNVTFAAAAEAPVSGMEGQVVDLDSGEPLAGAQVCVQGSDQCASVDESGSYSLNELDPAEYVFEVSATDYITAVQTITLASGETLAQDFALTATNPVLAVLPDEAVLRGAVVTIDSVDEASLGVGNTFQFLNDTPWNVSFPEYNIQAGDITLAVAIENGVGFTQIAILVPKLSETELGKVANNNLLGSVYSVTAVGESNQPVKPDDFMEVILTDPTSSNPPYTVNFYRGEGEARQLVATFTIDKQQ